MRKLIAGLITVGLLATACSGDDDDSGADDPAPADTEATGTDTQPPDTAGTTTADGTAGDGTEPTAPSTPPESGDIIPATGIDGNTVKIVIPGKMEACGDDEATANANVFTDATIGVLDEYVAFFNDEVLADTGYVIEAEYVDDGGVYCPEKARAAGRQIVEEIKPFAVIGDSQNLDQGPIVADMVTSAGIRHIGLAWNTTAPYAERPYYAFGIVHLAETAMVNLVDYIAARVADTPGHDPDTREEVPERHYGYVTIDLPEYHDIVDIVAAEMEAAGLTLEQTYFLSPDPAVAGQNAATLVTRMAEDGINSLLFDFFGLAGAVSGSTLTQTMAQQNYRPDIYVGTKGLAAIFGPLWEPTVWEHAEGISFFSPLGVRAALVMNDDGTFGYDPAYADINENVDPVVDIWEHLGHTDDVGVTAGTSIHNIVFGMGVLAAGILESEGELTAESWAEGLWSTAIGEENRCTLNRFYTGTDELHTPNASYAKGDHRGPITQFTTVHWVSEPTDLGLPGYWESYDNYVYVESMDELPAEPSHDTSVTPPDIPLPEPVGLHPWTTCEEVGLE